MIAIFISFVKFYVQYFVRRVFWLFKLSQSSLGRNVSLQFPIIREGKGSFYFGDYGVIQSHVQIGVGEKAELRIQKKSRLESKSIILVNKNCSLTIGERFKLGQFSRLYVQNDWQIGNGVVIETNCSFFARESLKSGKLLIGDGSNIGDFTIIDLVEDVKIGKQVAVGPNCTLYTHDHEYRDKNLPAWKGGIVSNPINIGDGAWIGSGVTILPGITIGERCVVAAGSVVTKDLEGGSIYGGVPAKLIKNIV